MTGCQGVCSYTFIQMSWMEVSKLLERCKESHKWGEFFISQWRNGTLRGKWEYWKVCYNMRLREFLWPDLTTKSFLSNSECNKLIIYFTQKPGKRSGVALVCTNEKREFSSNFLDTRCMKWLQMSDTLFFQKLLHAAPYQSCPSVTVYWCLYPSLYSPVCCVVGGDVIMKNPITHGTWN